MYEMAANLRACLPQMGEMRMINNLPVAYPRYGSCPGRHLKGGAPWVEFISWVYGKVTWKISVHSIGVIFCRYAPVDGNLPVL